MRIHYPSVYRRWSSTVHVHPYWFAIVQPTSAVAGGGGDWYPAYATKPDGTLNTSPWTGTWSPFGEGWTNNGERHAGSPLPRMAVPQFPNRDGGITACLLGEFSELLILSSGYTLEEAPVPGYIAFVGDADEQAYVVPAPATFTLL